ncbi:ABC transporter permease subunit [Paenibacillus glycanilyticus]|uniref:ABC transporter permease subunit n=1 Tax=Paenibacillus glycanilyticus TaxID=126569 RepID=UPI00203D7DE4|nr:ABC transporter permease subunit [Paenibacillus glycanilyticus]MCM3628549.1 ABC transporter permease subunit [Paenibacillus glycanilyticus]
MIAVWMLTWKELLRKKVTLMTLLLTVLFWIAFYFIAKSAGATAAQSESGIISLNDLVERFRGSAILLWIGFFFGAFATGFLSIFSSVAAVAGEAEHGVLQSVLARPIPRTHWYLGRWLGFVTFCLAYALLLFVSILIIVIYATGVHPDWSGLVPAFMLFISPVLIMVTLTMLASCWLAPLGNGVAMVMLFGMGWLGTMLDKVIAARMFTTDDASTTSDTLEIVSGLIRLIIPTDALQQRMLSELFRVDELGETFSSRDSLGYFSVVNPPSDAFLYYTAVYFLIFLAAGLFAIRRKDF